MNVLATNCKQSHFGKAIRQRDKHSTTQQRDVSETNKREVKHTIGTLVKHYNKTSNKQMVGNLKVQYGAQFCTGVQKEKNWYAFVVRGIVTSASALRNTN